MKTVFIRAMEGTAQERAASIRAAVSDGGANRFEVELSTLGKIPGTPFAYWIGDNVRRLFSEFEPFENGDRIVRQGGVTGDDFRFVRAAWETYPRDASGGFRWVPYAKGGSVAVWYSEYPVVVAWDDRRSTFWGYTGLKHRPSIKPSSADHYFRAGLTWPLRAARFAPVPLPEGAIFSIRGYAILAPKKDLLAICAVGRSTVFDHLFKVALGRLGFPEFVVGVLQKLPFPSLTASQAHQLSSLARQGWLLARRAHTRLEESHSFVLPALLQVVGDTLAERAMNWLALGSCRETEFSEIQCLLDDVCAGLFGLSIQDRERIESGVAPVSEPHDDESGNGTATDEQDGDDSEAEDSEVDTTPMVASLLSWMLGVAFGRFDVRLATDEREAPPEPEPFDPLPVCSPGMLTGNDGLPVPAPPSGYPLTFPTDGILVDDPGHPRDIVRTVRSVFEAVFDDANARWHEAAELLGAPDLRTWFARDFFEPHIKRYSKSRRKAPIYWQLATASGSYSVWIYIHCATADTLFRVLNDFVGPKLDHEKTKLDGLTQEAGANPSAAQRRELAQQETFVGELQALKGEVARVAPLWKPNLDDGVILNFAPLWRLVPQSRSWQGECKKAWDKLQGGDYDWAHLAMHLWSERVVPKCIDDRSLAIAHGLEDVFWHEDDSGTWRKSRVDDATVQRLIQERTSTTVKAALKDLLSAAAPTASKGRKAKSRSASPRTSAPKPAPAAARATTANTSVDEATLHAVKAAIASVADGASKADVLAATGLSDGDWNKAIAALLDRGDVTRTGQKRGTRYHSRMDSDA